ncbi:hypothetical protein J7I44_04940 [Frateuria sp. MAH-13]|uniref:Porin domain-containing protein n=1 Tax=Frateuria flava TaxID=2821489 RepID=A0ABS4DKQ8_9GAMM|nr:hypothetical protein [Frateuria flava]MBP1473634.1 hypothetical protein [Frateuria flava]
MSRIFLRAAVLATALSAACAAHASDDGFSWRFSGFGTAGYAATNSDDVLFTNPGQLKGARKGGSALVDSRVGGQIDFSFTPKLGATVQAIAMQDARGRFRPQLEWGFVSYKASDNVTVRLGRLGWPAYLVSDYRYVGYANPWLRAPLEVYNLAALDRYEGADLRWSHDLADGVFTLQLLEGHASSPLPESTERNARIKVNQLSGAYATYEIGNLRVRGGLSTGKATYVSQNTDMLAAGLGMAGYGAVATRLLPQNNRATFLSLGGTYDAHNIMATGEYGKLRSSGLLGVAQGWYGTLGWRHGDWMPYATWAGYSKQDDSDLYAVPPVGPLLPLSMGVSQLAAGNDQHTASLGVRWDAASKLAIKAQFDHVRPSVAGGTFTKIQPGYNGHPVNVVSVAADFVF